MTDRCNRRSTGRRAASVRKLVRQLTSQLRYRTRPSKYVPALLYDELHDGRQMQLFGRIGCDLIQTKGRIHKRFRSPHPHYCSSSMTTVLDVLIHEAWTGVDPRDRHNKLVR